MNREANALGLSMGEFVAMMAMMMAMTALSVDVMLVVLPDMAAYFSLTDPNQQQFIVTVYLVAFATGHLIAGPLSDRLGRRPIIMAGLVVYFIGGAVALSADSFTMLLVGRAIQGIGAAGPRVVAVAVVRDNFAGRAMSQVMSFIMMVFIMVPIIAPAIGSLIAMAGSWHTIFAFLLLVAALNLVWVYLRLPETNKALIEHKPVTLVEAIRLMINSRLTMGYMLALGFLFGGLMNYVATSQQLFADVYGIVDWFPAAFASGAAAMVVATFVNARLVQKLGMRLLSHGALLALIGASILASLSLLVSAEMPVAMMLGFTIICFFCIGIILPNFNAIAMEPLGRVAGTGAAFVGFVMTGIGAVLGGAMGQLYNQTVGPLVLGYLIYSSIVLAIVLVTERGKILTPSTAHATR
ncbi:Bcr/CflA family efflux MFS transporter [Acuticoccus kandeliae]|uniref:Bcr/CflA family efflux MFS transporter n=1 Tax=Acuticoccus kandeliae TaxID=2073160 RepID=UPI000D3E05E8|nr:Bcr/CflA family efflux MFS transporter [Acuticoccus kandeliae]